MVKVKKMFFISTVIGEISEKFRLDIKDIVIPIWKVTLTLNVFHSLLAYLHVQVLPELI